MLFSTFLFYLFSAILLASALVVVSARNTVYSVVFLILAFLNAAGLFIMLRAEFLAMLLIIVYVGAIAVLFLFVVMMLNIDRKQLQSNVRKYSPLVAAVATVLLMEIILLGKSIVLDSAGLVIRLFPLSLDSSNTEEIGKLIYTDFILPFQLAGAVLFVAMIGAIVLTLKEERRFIKRQNIAEQVLRKKSDSVKIVKVKSGKGVDI